MKLNNEQFFSIARYLILSGFVFFSPNSLVAQNNTSSKTVFTPDEKKQKFCRVFGEAKDYNGAVLPESFIKFKNSNFEKLVKTDYSGKYNVALPKGIYEVETKIRYGLDSYKRANINVSCDNKILVNMYSFPDIVLDNGSALNFKFNSFSNPNSNKELNVVISYLNQEINGTSVVYTRAFITYDSYTIYANKIIQSLNRQTIRRGDSNGTESYYLRLRTIKLMILAHSSVH